MKGRRSSSSDSMDTQGGSCVRPGLSGGGMKLELTPSSSSPLAMDVTETVEMRIQRLISENPVVIFARPSCCMCHAMRRLFSTVGVHPTVIELDHDHEITALSSATFSSFSSSSSSSSAAATAGGDPPTVFIGGKRVGSLETLVALHLSGDLVPRLTQIGAISM